MRDSAEETQRTKGAARNLLQKLVVVAHDLYGKGAPEARAWVAPLLQQVRNDQTTAMITTLAELSQLAIAKLVAPTIPEKCEMRASGDPSDPSAVFEFPLGKRRPSAL